MKLEEYRRRQNLTLAALGELIGVTDVAVHRYEHGRVPEPKVLRRIIEATGGAVQANDFFDEASAA